MSFSKHKDIQLKEQIRRLLLEEWDPIGIKNIPEAKDEYDDYIVDLYEIIMRDETPKKTLLAYLTWLETEHMGLSHNLEGIEKIIEKMLRFLEEEKMKI